MSEDLAKLLQSYKVPAEAVGIINNTKIVFLVGISGAGKDTILKELLKKEEYQYIVSHTTRSPRSNKGKLETEGVEYHFVDIAEISKMLQNGEFIEAKKYGENIYGTSVAEVHKAHQSNKIAITDIEVQGVEEYKAVAPNVVAIFLLPPDFETWQTRLKARYGDKHADSEDIKDRMSTAKLELQEALDKDYFEFVVNDDLDRAIQAVDDIVHGETSSQKNEEAKKLARNILSSLEVVV